MVHISKSDAVNSMLLESHMQRKVLMDKLELFQQKHHCPLEEFEKKLQKARSLLLTGTI